MEIDMTNKELYRLALHARENSYAPYSKFSVGAALLSKSGKVYTGANIENSAYSPSVCAERVAIFSAIAAGEREFSKIAIAGGASDGAPKESFPPCGVCRQVMAEFCDGDFKIILSEDTVLELSELLPHSFDKEYLK